MRVSALKDDDWTFGKGRAGYLSRSDAIKQDLLTRMRSFKDDWFANVNHGGDWDRLLSTRGNADRLKREAELIAINTEGVASVQNVRITTENRHATITMTVTDIFSNTFNIEVNQS